jgi:hypothetical protein
MTKADREHDAHKFLTFELRQDLIRLQKQMEEYATKLNNLCRNLESINDAVFTAQEFTERLFEALFPKRGRHSGGRRQ